MFEAGVAAKEQRIAGGDPVLDALYLAPCRVVRPAAQAAPFVFASPHSGRLYPPSFVARSRLSATALRRSEDAFVDAIFSTAVELGAPLIAAEFPRAYLDVNRAPAELDPAMFAGPLPFPVDATSPRVNAGLGAIPKLVRDGAEIYRERLPAAEAARRLDGLYRPYHAMLMALVEETRARFGTAIVVDCHSMPSAAAVPDVVLGDRYGMSAAPVFVRAAERALEAQGFSVARNVPYAGGYTTIVHGRPARGVQAIQIEINRSLYLDEETIEPSARFGEIRTRIGDALRHLMAAEAARLSDMFRRPEAHAAE